MWIVAHGRSRTTVCSQWFTDGAVHCLACDAGELAHIAGYVPLYREIDCRPCMVLVKEDARHQIDALFFHQRVIVGRDKIVNATCYVIPALVQEPGFKTTLAERLRPADISRSLLAVWRNPAVTSWHYATKGEPQPGPTLATPPAGKSATPPRRAKLAGELERKVPPPPDVRVDATPLSELHAPLMEKLKARERAANNGKPDVTE